MTLDNQLLLPLINQKIFYEDTVCIAVSTVNGTTDVFVKQTKIGKKKVKMSKRSKNLYSTRSAYQF